MYKYNRVLNISWVVIMLFFSSFDFYVMLTDFNVWVLIGFLCCGASAVLKGIEMCREDIRKEKYKERFSNGDLKITTDFKDFMDFINKDKDKGD